MFFLINGYLRKYVRKLGHYNHATEVRGNFLIEIILVIGKDNQKATRVRQPQDKREGHTWLTVTWGERLISSKNFLSISFFPPESNRKDHDSRKRTISIFTRSLICTVNPYRPNSPILLLHIHENIQRLITTFCY